MLSATLLGEMPTTAEERGKRPMQIVRRAEIRYALLHR